MKQKTNRRDFLKTSTLAGAGFWVASRSAWAQSKSPNEKLNIACIGTGGMGGGDTDSVASQNIVALCDVRPSALDSKKEKFPKAKVYSDYRKMFDEMAKEIDAVTVSTPDHTHAPAAMSAMKRGIHCFVQKPLAHDVWEARELTRMARELKAKGGGKLCTQMGNQGTSSSGLRKAVETVWSGMIGPVKEVHVWTNRPIWPQGAGAILGLSGVKAAMSGKGDVKPEADDVDWDLWLGTSPLRPFQPEYQPFKWRGWWDWGTGALGDMACHTANMAFMACKLGSPTSVEAEVSEYNSETYPMWSVLRYEFPARGDLPPMKWTWYDGGRDKPAWVNKKLTGLAHDHKISDSGSLLIGEKATLFSPNDYGEDWVLLPEGTKRDDVKVEQTLPRSPGHKEEWFAAIRENKPELAMSNFSYAGPLTETVVLGCVAIRAGKKIDWDGPNLKVTNDKDDKINQYIKREYRKGWEV
jgi:predicted dehydrogenase